MVELSIIRDLVAIFGVIAGFSYYVLTVRNSQRMQELTLKSQEESTKARQTQLFMQIFQDINSEKSWETWLELVKCSYNDYDDFVHKYDSDVNPENWRKRMRFWYSYNAIGYLLKDGVISTEQVERLVGRVVLGMWNVWGDAIIWMREKQGLLNWFSGFEYLYKELAKYYRENPELTPANPDIAPKYTPKYE